jgi:Spy/CpxP family protein refolding chaperone
MVSGARAKVLGVLGATFVLGALAGGGGAYAYAERQQAKQLSEERVEVREGRWMTALTRELALTPAQQAAVSAINEKHRTRRHELARDAFERCGEKMKEHRAQVEAEIKATLTPEQQVRFDELSKARREGGPPGSPSGPGGRGRRPD